MNNQAPFISINCNAPIRSIGEFESVLALIPILSIGNVLDAIRDKVNAYLKLMEDHCSPDLVASYRQRYVDACNAPSPRYKEEGSPKEELKLIGVSNNIMDNDWASAPTWREDDTVVLPDPNANRGIQTVDRNPQTKLPL